MDIFQTIVDFVLSIVGVVIVVFFIGLFISLPTQLIAGYYNNGKWSGVYHYDAPKNNPKHK